MQYWNTTNKTIVLALAGLFGFLHSFSQENSPYSRYALGNIKLTENVANRGMGGVSIADDNSLITNPTNPASFSFLKLTSFQIGVEGVSTNIKSSTLSNRAGSMTLSYVNIGLPIAKNLGVSFGLIPITRSKYSMAATDTINGISKVDYNYYGGGGTQKIYVGAAYKFKDYSLGFNTGYMFGNIINSSEASFTDSLKIISSSVTSRTTLGGVFLQLGGMMNKTLKDDYKATIGATYTLSQNLNAKKDSYWKSFVGDVSSPDYYYNVDSIIEKKGTIVFPGKLGTGIMFRKGDIWKAGIDFTTSDWKKYKSYDESDSTNASWMIKIGGSITPDITSVGQTWKKVTYRLGAYIGQDILSFKGTNLKTSGVTAGIGYPIKRSNLALSIGQINAAIELGQRGTTSNGLIKEGYTRFSVGFTFNDKWFIKRKYD